MSIKMEIYTSVSSLETWLVTTSATSVLLNLLELKLFRIRKCYTFQRLWNTEFSIAFSTFFLIPIFEKKCRNLVRPLMYTYYIAAEYVFFLIKFIKLFALHSEIVNEYLNTVYFSLKKCYRGELRLLTLLEILKSNLCSAKS